MNRRSRPRLVGAVVLVVLVAAMLLNTRFVTPDELAALQPEQFDPEATAAELFEQAQADLPGAAAPLADVVAGVQSDPTAAGEEFSAVSPSGGTLVFTVEATGTVVRADDQNLQLRVEGVPAQTDVLVPVGVPVNGTVLRDALGFTFADAPGQSTFQFVGDELKGLMQQSITEGLGGDPASLQDQQVTVVGVFSATEGAPAPAAKPVVVQPVTGEVG